MALEPAPDPLRGDPAAPDVLRLLELIRSRPSVAPVPTPVDEQCVPGVLCGGCSSRLCSSRGV